MPQILLLCFIHGFKGSEDTFHEFPYDLKREVARDLPDHHVESVIYPKFETQGELSQASGAFLEWSVPDPVVVVPTSCTNMSLKA
jgi:hypothetical protein